MRSARLSPNDRSRVETALCVGCIDARRGDRSAMLCGEELWHAEEDDGSLYVAGKDMEIGLGLRPSRVFVSCCAFGLSSLSVCRERAPPSAPELYQISAFSHSLLVGSGLSAFEHRLRQADARSGGGQGDPVVQAEISRQFSERRGTQIRQTVNNSHLVSGALAAVVELDQPRGVVMLLVYQA